MTNMVIRCYWSEIFRTQVNACGWRGYSSIQGGVHLSYLNVLYRLRPLDRQANLFYGGKT